MSSSKPDKIKRVNCFGDVEMLDRESVTEALETEEYYNLELEAYLTGISLTEGRERRGVPVPEAHPKHPVTEGVDREAETVRPLKKG